MKYRNQQYAEALLSTLEGKPSQKRSPIIKNFLALLHRRGDFHRLPAIVRECEKRYLRRTGQRNVEIESASPPSLALRDAVGSLFGPSFSLKETARPELLAGVRITVDHETFIDATAWRILTAMFQEKS